MVARLLLLLPMVAALLRPRPASRCMPTHLAQRTRHLFAQLAEWTPLVDEVSGATYYYNERTGQSQWEAPQAAAAQDYGQAAWQPPQRSDPQGSGARDAYQVLWRIDGRRLCSGGRISLRRHDVEVLSRYHMLKQKLTVSRKQAEVACLEDGSATLTSVGWGATPNANPNPNPKPSPHPHPHPHPYPNPDPDPDPNRYLNQVGRGATLWRERGGPWCSVQRGESLTLTDGDQAGLYPNPNPHPTPTPNPNPKPHADRQRPGKPVRTGEPGLQSPHISLYLR